MLHPCLTNIIAFDILATLRTYKCAVLPWAMVKFHSISWLWHCHQLEGTSQGPVVNGELSPSPMNGLASENAQTFTKMFLFKKTWLVFKGKFHKWPADTLMLFLPLPFLGPEMSGKGTQCILVEGTGDDSMSNFLKALKSMMKQAVVFQNLVNLYKWGMPACLGWGYCC